MTLSWGVALRRRADLSRQVAWIRTGRATLATMDQRPWCHYNRLVDFDEAKRVLAAFQREEVRYVLIGSMAMAAQGLIRATRDIDFFVSPDRDNIERLRRALKSVFEGDPNVDEITAEDLDGDYPAIEYTPPHGRYSLDILSRLGEAFCFEDLESEVLVIDGISIHVATPGQLYRMKKSTVRPQDRMDAQAIRERFNLEDGD